MQEKKVIIKCGDEQSGQRLDIAVTARIKEFTRQYVQKLITAGEIKVNGKEMKAGFKLRSGDRIEVRVPAPVKLDLEPYARKLDIIHEDKDYLVINKSEGMVVHPGAGESHTKDSLVNALLAHCGKSLSGIGGVMRPGIVHRLDKDTSGLIVVAKNDKSHRYFADLFKSRQVKKTYYALVSGILVPEKGVIDAPIGRNPGDRKKMAVTTELKGRNAVTKYKVIASFKDSTLVEINLITGRTHQIRVHFEAIGFPLAGDNIYGKASVNKKFERNYGLKRLFLHAGLIEFVPPGKKKARTFRAELPEELQRTINLLKREVEL